MLKTKDLQDEI